MLDFILVMGHVPGTNIDLTFYQIVFGIPLIAVAIYIYRKNTDWIKRFISELYAASRDLVSTIQTKLPKLLAR